MDKNQYQEDLSHIRSMMERSSRFISLSGLSGVFIGLTALVGAIYVYFLFQKNRIDYFDGYAKVYSTGLILELIFTALVILVVALFFGAFFTIRKSRKKNLPIWTTSTQQLLINFSLPLAVGGLFSAGLLYHGKYVFLSSVTLIFYGLALIFAEKYTYSELKYLGICEIVLGILSLFFLGWGLLFWALGFGVLHIVYGVLMYKKYE